MIIRAYGDETGTHDASPFMMLAGFVGKLGQWNEFDKAWNRKLNHAGLKYFHGTEHWDTEAGSRFAPHIDRLTRKHLLFGYVIKLDKESYKNFFIAGERPNKPQLDTMYGVMFRFLSAFLLTRLPSLIGRSDLRVEIILESGANGSADSCRIIKDMHKQLPVETEIIESVCFQEKKKYPGLQASDALAYGALKLEPTSQIFLDLPEGGDIPHAKRAAPARPPIFRCDIDAATLGALKGDILALVEIRRQYVESMKG